MTNIKIARYKFLQFYYVIAYIGWKNIKDRLVSLNMGDVTK